MALLKYLSGYDIGVKRTDISKYPLSTDFVPNHAILCNKMIGTANRNYYWIFFCIYTYRSSFIVVSSMYKRYLDISGMHNYIQVILKIYST